MTKLTLIVINSFSNSMTPRNVAQLRVALGMHALKPKMDAEIFKKVWRVSFHRNFNIETYVLYNF